MENNKIIKTEPDYCEDCGSFGKLELFQRKWVCYVCKMKRSKIITNPNEKKIFEIMKKYGNLTRPEIIKLSGMPRTTIYDNLTKLQLKGFVWKYSKSNGKRGRPLVYFQVIL